MPLVGLLSCDCFCDSQVNACLAPLCSVDGRGSQDLIAQNHVKTIYIDVRDYTFEHDLQYGHLCFYTKKAHHPIQKTGVRYHVVFGLSFLFQL